MFKRLFSSALVFGMAAMAPPALAVTCAPREGLVQHLQTAFSESLSSAGLQNSQPVDTMIEIWSSADLSFGYQLYRRRRSELFQRDNVGVPVRIAKLMADVP
jgi:hypothetical protein